MKLIGCLFLLLICLPKHSDQIKRNRIYHIGGFPILHTHASSCGRASSQISRHAVCDVENNVGNEEDRKRIDTVALELYNETHCDCQDRTKCKWGGYTIGIMIVSEMGPAESREKLLEVAQNNANHLRDSWNVGQCGDDLIIFFSVKENALATAVGNVTSKKLSKSQIFAVQNRVRPQLVKGNLTDGLIELVRLYKIELQKANWWLEGWIVALIIVAVILLLIALGAIAFYCVKSRRKDVYNTHSAKYQPAKSNDPDVTADTKLSQPQNV